jgi:hypothetical protein
MLRRNSVLIVLAMVVAGFAAMLTSTTATADTSHFGVQGANEVYIQNADGRWEHFWVHDTNRNLYHVWELTPGGSLDWPGARNLGGTLVYDQIDAAINANGRLEVFGVGTDKAMFDIWQTTAGGGWSGWQTMGGGFNGPPTVGYTSYGGIIVYGAGLDNQLYRRHQTQPNCCWSSGWVRV